MKPKKEQYSNTLPRKNKRDNSSLKYLRGEKEIDLEKYDRTTTFEEHLKMSRKKSNGYNNYRKSLK